jgi:hypothetical protein
MSALGSPADAHASDGANLACNQLPAATHVSDNEAPLPVMRYLMAQS